MSEMTEWEEPDISTVIVKHGTGHSALPGGDYITL